MAWAWHGRGAGVEQASHRRRTGMALGVAQPQALRRIRLMSHLHSGLTGLVVVCSLRVAGAQPSLPPLPAAPAASAAVKAGGGLQKQVIEDDAVRIEETRLRGQPQRITVQSKLPGAKAYEILVAPAGKDPSQNRGAANQRAWSLFDF